MKKLFILLCAVCALASCATFGLVPGPKFTFVVNDPYGDDAVKIDVPSLETVSRVSTGMQVVGVDIRIQNTSPKTFTVKWGDSSIAYDGKSRDIFLSGNYKSNVASKMPDAILFSHSRVSFAVYPADNVPTAAEYQSSGTPIGAISSKDISCSIAINVAGEARVYQVRVLIEAPPAHRLPRLQSHRYTLPVDFA